MGIILRNIFLFILFMTCLPALGQEDSLLYSISLDSVVIKANRYTSDMRVDAVGAIKLDMGLMDELPKILGNADPIHYIQMLPGVQTKGEYKSGINIYGCDNSHNLVSINGVPIYNVNHLLGLFSIFNASHYNTLELIKNSSSANSPNRLGGVVDVSHKQTLYDSLSGEFSVGIISSQGTVKSPIGDKSDLLISLRASYLNLLYGSFLQTDGLQLDYAFYDGNLTFRHNLNSKNQVVLDCYLGIDKGGFDENKYLANMNARWGSKMGALHWVYEDRCKIRNSLYVTNYRNRFKMGVEDMIYNVPSSITEFGYRGSVEYKSFTAGVDYAYRVFQPQEVSSANDSLFVGTNSDDMYSNEVSGYFNYSYPISDWIKLSVGIRGDLYRLRSEGLYGALNPNFAFLYDNEDMQISLAYALRHQYLFQSGFVDSGLPTEFWVACGDKYKPQYSHSFALGFSKFFAKRLYKVSVDAFYKRLYNQVEYSGAIFDLLSSDYSYDSHLAMGEGTNWGVGVTLNKCAGKLLGWVSYSYTQANRAYSDEHLSGKFPAGHERPHEFDAVLTYNLNKRWSLGSTLVFASGTPFTAPKNIALINGEVVVFYGEHNAMRLRPYCRVDLSVNYRWRCRYADEHGLNFSLYNVSGRSNDLFYGLKVGNSGEFAYRPITFALRVMPSVSYFCKF